MVDTIAIKNGKLIDGTGRGPVPNMVVIIQGSKIVEIGEKLTVPQSARVIDASGKTLLPGLIDGHVHLNSDPRIDPFQRFLGPDSLVNLRAARNARITLEAGYTSILGSCGYGNYADLFLRDAINNGWIPGPRLWTSGPAVTSTLRRGGHLKYGFPPRRFAMADGVEELRKLVRTHIVSGVDWIKVLATYACASPNSEPALMNLNEEELKVIADEAHSQKKKAKVHLEGRKTTKEALAAGLDIFLHGFFLDVDDVEVMKKKGIPLIPTLAWGGELARTGAPGQPDWYVKKAKSYSPNHVASFKRAHEAGVLIAAGTDCSGGGSAGDFLRHGENGKELEYMVLRGMTTMEALMAGTRNVAEAFGLQELIGTIEEGKLADITILSGDPLEDITLLQDKDRIELVIKNGDIVVENGVSRACKCPPLKPFLPGFLSENG